MKPVCGATTVRATLGCSDSAQCLKSSVTHRDHLLLAAQSLPGNSIEEGMTFDVTYTPTSRAKAITSIELEQL